MMASCLLVWDGGPSGMTGGKGVVECQRCKGGGLAESVVIAE